MELAEVPLASPTTEWPGVYTVPDIHIQTLSLLGDLEANAKGRARVSTIW
jgi:hypothetical protein